MPFYAPSKGGLISDIRSGLPSADILMPLTDTSFYGFSRFSSQTVTSVNNTTQVNIGYFKKNDMYFCDIGAGLMYQFDASFNYVKSYADPNGSKLGNSTVDTGDYLLCVSPSAVANNLIGLYDPASDVFAINNLNSTPSGYTNRASLLKSNNEIYLLNNDGVYKLTGTLATGANNAANPPGWASPWTLISPPPAAWDVLQSGIGSCIRYDSKYIDVFGYTDSASTTHNVFYSYDIANNSWASANPPFSQPQFVPIISFLDGSYLGTSGLSAGFEFALPKNPGIIAANNPLNVNPYGSSTNHNVFFINDKGLICSHDNGSLFDFYDINLTLRAAFNYAQL